MSDLSRGRNSVDKKSLNGNPGCLASLVLFAKNIFDNLTHRDHGEGKETHRKLVTVCIGSTEQYEKLTEKGEIVKAVGSKLIVVKDDNGRCYIGFLKGSKDVDRLLSGENFFDVVRDRYNVLYTINSGEKDGGKENNTAYTITKKEDGTYNLTPIVDFVGEPVTYRNEDRRYGDARHLRTYGDNTTLEERMLGGKPPKFNINCPENRKICEERPSGLLLYKDETPEDETPKDEGYILLYKNKGILYKFDTDSDIIFMTDNLIEVKNRKDNSIKGYYINKGVIKECESFFEIKEKANEDKEKAKLHFFSYSIDGDKVTYFINYSSKDSSGDLFIKCDEYNEERRGDELICVNYRLKGRNTREKWAPIKGRGVKVGK